MVRVINSKEEVLKSRLSRRGFSGEDCRRILKAHKGNVILMNKFSQRNHDLKDFVGVTSC